MTRPPLPAPISSGHRDDPGRHARAVAGEGLNLAAAGLLAAERRADHEEAVAHRERLSAFLDSLLARRLGDALTPGELARVELLGRVGVEPEGSLRVCPCGRVFEQPTRGRRRTYCSDACRKAEATPLPPGPRPVLVRRDPDSGYVELIADCPDCGAAAWARPGQRTYCRECGSEAGRQRRKRARA